MLNTLLEREVAKTQLGEFGLDPSLVLYLPLWKKDGGVISSEDGYGHTCTVTEATWGSQGRTFDGSDDVIACGTAGGSLDITGTGLTLEAWIKPTDKGAASAQRIFNKAGATGGYYLRTPQDYATANYKFYIYIGGWRNLTVNSIVSYATWQHFVATYNGVNMILYKNGVSVGSTPQAGNITSSSDVVLDIGGGDFFKGIYGEARIYSRALSADEIMNNYLATKWRYQ